MADQNTQVQDNAVQPTEEEVKAANVAEQQRWEGDFPEEDLQIKYKPDDEVIEEKAKESDSDDDSEEIEVEVYEDPTPILTTSDPGDYLPKDYGFEVMLASGKSVKVSNPEDAEKLADNPDNFETPKQLMDFLTKSQKMQGKLDRDYDKWETQKEQFENQSQTETQRVQTVQNIAAEFDYLVSKKLLPAVPSEYKDADWQDPQVAKQDGVRQHVELLDYMVKENEARAKAKVSPITSIIDAYNSWKLENNESQEKEDRKEAGQARKVASSKVSGVASGGGQPFVPKGIAVGRVNAFGRNQANWEN